MHLATAPSVDELLARLSAREVAAALQANPDGQGNRYLHWDKLTRMEPPAGLSHDQWWLKLKIARQAQWRALPLSDREGNPLGFTLPEPAERAVHRVEERHAMAVGARDPLPSQREARRRLFVNSLMEEAIRSSQIEGAATSREDAKELLRDERRPRDRGERMIANNYRALQFVRAEVGELTPEAVLELHRILTEGTLDEPEAAGRLQRPGEERVRVFERDGGKAIHLPPPAEQLPHRLELLCEFANADEDSAPFVHPVVRAILLHFWLAYDHPFLDGNGRTARILFLWGMRNRGYRFAELLPLSRLIHLAPGRYRRAFLETETDGGDTTHFLLHQLDVIERAIADLDRYVERNAAEQEDVKLLLHDVEGINGRQLVLLTHALKHPGHEYTFAGHARSNLVTHETARADLGGLGERGFLIRRRRGRAYVFEPAPDLPRRLKESTA